MSKIPMYTDDEVAVNRDGPLKPELGERLAQFTVFKRISRLWCGLVGYPVSRRYFIRDHIWLSQTYYTGTSQDGTGWQVCGRCGKTEKSFYVVSPATH